MAYCIFFAEQMGCKPVITLGSKVEVSAEAGRSASLYNGSRGEVTGRYDNGLLVVTTRAKMFRGEQTGRYAELNLWPSELVEAA